MSVFRFSVTRHALAGFQAVHRRMRIVAVAAAQQLLARSRTRQKLLMPPAFLIAAQTAAPANPQMAALLSLQDAFEWH